MAYLEFRDLCKTYHKAKAPVLALQGVSFQVEKGEFIAILGKSGSGKSTLLNLLGGLDTPTSGEIRIDGANLFAEGKSGLVEHRRHRIGMVFQSFQLIPSQTAQENIELALAFKGVTRSARKERALQLLDSVGLRDRADHYPSELSGGEAQRVAIARALANNPQIILADEPTGNLDTQNGKIVMDILKDLHRLGHTIIMITHDPDMATIAQRVVRMRDGHIESIANG
jgi:putative ABC transport system ATP-binding protein